VHSKLHHGTMVTDFGTAAPPTGFEPVLPA
jgi:hypothetical protein